MEVPLYVRYLPDQKIEIVLPDQPEKPLVVGLDEFVGLDDDFARSLGQFLQASVISQWMASKHAAPDLVNAILSMQSSPNRTSPEQQAGIAIRSAIAERIVHMTFSGDHRYRLDDLPKLFDAAVVLGVKGAETYVKFWPAIRDLLSSLALEKDEDKKRKIREQLHTVISDQSADVKSGQDDGAGC